ncbi:MAG: glycoside hydrolase family 5 protein, partial [Muribaculaceae bacterium]|nr:glycoside hydrolase family 5 protein [Muribaculaceae bacterium]
IVITPLTVDMVYNALGLGWNLGNQLDAHIDGNANETSWGNPAVTQSLFDAVKRAGFTSVRIPVTWMGHVGEAPDYTIDEAWLNRVAEVVGYAENAGLTVIINIHHDGADSNYWLDIKHAATDEALNAAIEAKLAAIWTQIARKFADKGEFLIFESMNEIHDGGWGWGDNRKDGGKQYRTFNHWQQVFVDAVRATGGRNLLRWLGVPAYNTNIDLGANLVIPTDPSQRVIVAVHCYEPYDYTLAANYPEWGHTGTSGKKPSSNEKTLIAEFDKVVNRWISKGMPVYIGEMGCVHRADARAESFRKYYLEYFAKGASDRRIPMLYWDNGYGGDGAEQSGLFDRTGGSFYNNAADIVKAMNRGFFDTSVTLDDIYNSAPK